MKHTPGPWSVNVIGQHWNNKSLKHIEVTFGQDGECICDTVYNPSDANLIAAAPDLLEVMQDVVEQWKVEHDEKGEPQPLWVKNCLRAISKALGEE